jgi:hypothetical protein
MSGWRFRLQLGEEFAVPVEDEQMADVHARLPRAPEQRAAERAWRKAGGDFFLDSSHCPTPAGWLALITEVDGPATCRRMDPDPPMWQWPRANVAPWPVSTALTSNSVRSSRHRSLMAANFSWSNGKLSSRRPTPKWYVSFELHLTTVEPRTRRPAS